ncbi:MAG: hypothetical protein NVSMB5_19240 [Candidatus Velthaea sp.]
MESRAFHISGLIDPTNRYSDECKPYAEVPAWWSGFLFHVLNTRQISLYLYLSLLSSNTGACHPTTKQIRQDLGLASLTIVFESMSVLEQYGFILRQRRKVEYLNSRRNIYQRPSCEFTVLRLLEYGKIDGLLRPTPGFVNETSDESRELRDEWLRGFLKDRYAIYEAASLDDKRTVLMNALRGRFTLVSSVT